MSIAVRSAQTTWAGSLAAGVGTLSNSSSGVLDDQKVTWAARTEGPGGKTSPEELAAAAHSSCYSMALSLKLGENQTPAQQLTVTASVTLDEVDGAPTVTTSALRVRAQVPGLDEAGFAKVVDDASALCPISRLFAGATITVDAALETA
ncbi:OsmC family peroxiredoxin [Ruania zhangjianzhongii]|uniref:OsmC family peroxiredoxin n=1 Tax=Ruania zhangjianzhongii TaxID=2603206 RepID=UPI0011CCB265|nr:OsmC family peroxiredoxin [Ruania zhangjianzhongii]